MSLDHELRALTSELAAPNEQGRKPVTAVVGTVTSWTGGVLTVHLEGVDLVVPRRVSTYTTPAADDEVLVLLLSGSPVVIGTLV